MGLGGGGRYITGMEKLFTYLIAIAMAAVLVVLLVGVGAMFKGGEFNRRHANRLMRLRVGLQALALLLFALFMLFVRNHD